MAVAVKNVPETTSRKPLNPLAVGSWLGVVYVLIAVLAVFYAMPVLWEQGIAPWLVRATNPFVDGALRILAMVAVAAGLVYFGLRLAGPHPPHGIRAGIFVGLVNLFLAGLLAQWVGMALESVVFDRQLFGTSS